MALDDALFWVERGGVKHYAKAQDLGDKMVPGDLVLVQRGDEKFYAEYDGSELPTLLDSDWLWAQKDGEKYKVSGENFKGLFDPTINLSSIQSHTSTLTSLNQYGFMPVTRANATTSAPYAEATFGIKAIALNNVRLDQYVGSNVDEAKITITQQSSGMKRLEGDVTSIQIPGNQSKNEVYVGFTPTFAPTHSWTSSNYRIEITGIVP